MKKILLIIFILLCLAIFSKNIFSRLIISGLSKSIEREVYINNIDINYFKKKIILNLVEVRNINKFYYKNIFKADKVIIQYNFNSIFENFIKIDYLSFLNPSFFLEFDNKNNPTIIVDDNIKVLEKLKKNYKQKTYPTKKKDRNFIILKTELNNSKAFIKISSRTKETKIDLSNMVFHKIGNKKGLQHYKKALEIILRDVFLKVPDQNLRDLIKKTYNL
tara:strand:+ start:827 stop:1483 length:657 start_codon:yes stop_codon:yes gene_type:complete